MGFFKKTVYKKMFLKEDVDEILFYYERQNKEKIKEKYETINPQFYQDVFNELVQQIPIEDALKLLNFRVLVKNKEELNLSWEYTEEKRTEIYNELKETAVIEKPSQVEEVEKQSKIEVKRVAKKQEVKRFRFVTNKQEVKPIKTQPTPQLEKETIVEEEGAFAGVFLEPMDIQPVPQMEAEFIEAEIHPNVQQVQAEVIQITKKKNPTEELGSLLFGK